MSHSIDMFPKGSLRLTDAEQINPVETTGQPAIDSNDRAEITVNDILRLVKYGAKNEAVGGDLVPALLAGMPDPFDFNIYFNHFNTGPVDDTTGISTDWEIVADAGSTAKAGSFVDMVGGALRVVCDGDDNDECYMASRCEGWKFAADKPMWFLTRIKHVAGTTAGKSTFIIGVSDTVAANSIVDAGTLMTSFDGAVFTKPEDGANIQFCGSNAAVQDLDTLCAFTAGGTFTLAFYFDPADGTTGTLTPYYNLTGGKTLTAGTTQNITLSGLEEMHIVMGVKVHESGNEPEINVDFLAVAQAL